MAKTLLGGLLLVLAIAGCTFLKDGTQTPILGNNDGVVINTIENTTQEVAGGGGVMPRGIELEGQSLGEYLDAIPNDDLVLMTSQRYEGSKLVYDLRDVYGNEVNPVTLPDGRNGIDRMHLFDAWFVDVDLLVYGIDRSTFDGYVPGPNAVSPYDGRIAISAVDINPSFEPVRNTMLTIHNPASGENTVVFDNTQSKIDGHKYHLRPRVWLGPDELVVEGDLGDSEEQEGLWIINIQTKELREIPIDPNYMGRTYFSPNGNYLLYSVWNRPGIKDQVHGVPNQQRLLDLNTFEEIIFEELVEGWLLKDPHTETMEDNFKTSVVPGFSIVENETFFTSNQQFCQVPNAMPLALPWNIGETMIVSRDGPMVQADNCLTNFFSNETNTNVINPNAPPNYICNQDGVPTPYSECPLSFGPGVFNANVGCPDKTCGHNRPALDFIPGTSNGEIRAMADGIVELVGWESPGNFSVGFGYRVRILHNDLTSATYGHLIANSDPGLAVNQSIKAGDLIGLMGSTGSSTGLHLHIEYEFATEEYYPHFGCDGNTFVPRSQYEYTATAPCCIDQLEPNNTNAQAVDYDPNGYFGGPNYAYSQVHGCIDWNDSDIGYVTCALQGQLTVYVQDLNLVGPVDLYTIDQSGNENILASGYSGNQNGLTFTECVPGNPCQPVYIRVSQGIGPIQFPDDYMITIIWSPTACTPSANLVSGNGGNNPLGFTSLTAVSASANPTSFCPGGSSVISMSGATQYTVSGPGGIVCSPCNGSSVTVYPPTTPGSYDYIVSDYSDPCGGGEATVSITVNDAPIANAGPDLVSAGAGSPVLLQGSYTYTGGQSVSSAWLPGPHLGLTPTVSPTSTTTYTLYTGIPGCGTSDQMTITVPGNGLVIIPSVSKVCSGSTIALTANGGNPPYTWVGGTIPQNTAGTSVTDNPVNPGTIIYSVTDNSGNGAVTSVIVHEIPTVEAGVDQNITTGQSTNLNGQGLYGSPPYAYQWTWPGGSSTQANPSVSPTTFTTYTLQVTDAEGCVSATDQMWIQPLSPPQHANLTFTGTNTVTQTGTSISGTVTVTNDGQVSTVVNPSIYVILHHQTQNFSIPLISENVPIGFAVNATQTETGSVPTNSFIPGKYFVSAVVDPSNYETETNENDNVYPFTQTFSLYPDLALANTSSSLSLAQVNDQLTITCDAINQGYVNAASSYHIRCFLSQDQIFDAGDIDIGNVQYFGLMVNNPIMNGSFTATIPSGTPNGQHYLIVMIDADNTNVELDEGNNVEIIPITIGCLTPTPDISFVFPLTRCAGLTDTVVTNTFTGNPNIWNDGQGNSDTTSFPASFPTYTTPGSYLFTLTVEDGCSTADTSVIITVVDTISLSAIITPSFSGTNGEIDLFVTGGQPSYTYEWSDGSLAEDLSGLVPDWYGVTVTDQANCLETDSFYVSATPFSVEWIGITANPLNEMDAEIELLGVFDQPKEAVVLERSRTGTNWQELHKQTVGPPLGEVYAIKFTDYGAALDTTVAYYRGKGIDPDGNVTYTSTASVRWTSAGFRILKIFPNPTRSTFTVQFHTNQISPVVIDVYNSIGQLVATQSLSDIGSGFGEIEFDATTWAEGVYFLHSTCGSAFSIDRITIR